MKFIFFCIFAQLINFKSYENLMEIKHIILPYNFQYLVIRFNFPDRYSDTLCYQLYISVKVNALNFDTGNVTTYVFTKTYI